MELSALNFSLSTTTILYTLLVASLIGSTRTLQIFNGTLTEITCSAAVPATVAVYRLMDHEGEYNSYNYFPDLFDIEARPSPTGNSVTLYINGTNRSNNVTVTCGYLDVSAGFSFNVLFTLILEFVSTLPAPNDVHYIYIEDPPGYLLILWEPPALDSDELVLQNVNIRKDARITSYIIYITTEESTVVQIYNASETYFVIGIDKIPCKFWFQVAAVNPAGVGECSPPQNLTFDLHTGCLGSTSSTTVIIMEPISASSGIPVPGELNYWGISATTIAALLAVVCIILAACLFTLLRRYRNGMNRHSLKTTESETAEKEIEMKQNEVYGINTRPL